MNVRYDIEKDTNPNNGLNDPSNQSYSMCDLTIIQSPTQNFTSDLLSVPIYTLTHKT